MQTQGAHSRQEQLRELLAGAGGGLGERLTFQGKASVPVLEGDTPVFCGVVMAEIKSGQIVTVHGGNRTMDLAGAQRVTPETLKPAENPIAAHCMPVDQRIAVFDLMEAYSTCAFVDCSQGRVFVPCEPVEEGTTRLVLGILLIPNWDEGRRRRHRAELADLRFWMEYVSDNET